jgi:hypothetical protein
MSHGAQGLSFPCWQREWSLHSASVYTETSKASWPKTKYRVPRPEVRSDLRKVTCPECWAAIAQLAKEKTK